MRRHGARWLLGIGIAVAVCGVASGESYSKRFVFKTGVILEIGAQLAEGARLESVRFELPAAGAAPQRRGTAPLAEIVLSNPGSAPVAAGVAVALFDDAGRLVAAANGGSVTTLKPGARRAVRLVFEGVVRDIGRAATFQLSVEGR